MTETYLAIDFGGGSGRVIAGYLSEGKLELDTVYRFPNRQIRMGKHIYWDFPALFEEMKSGIRMAIEKGYRIKSIGIDTWGVDFGLIDRQGNLIGNPVCYRDSRTQGMPEEVFARLDIQKHYASAGIQIMPINTLFQLYAMKKEGNPQLDIADRLLFMPDLFSYFLTGTANNEYSIASTSELMDAKAKNWDFELIRELGLPEHLFREIVMPGTSRGTLKPEIMQETGIDYEVQVMAVASHDTASAVYAIQDAHTDSTKAFLSSGTWSLLGTLQEDPILTEEARQAGFTNEGGADGKICFLQNITGLWILQQLMALWKEKGICTDYGYLLQQAAASNIPTVIDVDDPMFQNPSNMEVAISEYCTAHHFPLPTSEGEFVRCIVQSLAHRYRKGIMQLNGLLPHPVTTLHILGGGSQNQLLNRLTEEIAGVKVETGPVEATAIGNIKMQMNHS